MMEMGRRAAAEMRRALRGGVVASALRALLRRVKHIDALAGCGGRNGRC
jgi:hypothetical protein